MYNVGFVCETEKTTVTIIFVITCQNFEPVVALSSKNREVYFKKTLYKECSVTVYTVTKLRHDRKDRRT